MKQLLQDTIIKSPIPAGFDLAHGAAGFFLGILMWVYMFLFGRILFCRTLFNIVVKMREASVVADNIYEVEHSLDYLLCISTGAARQIRDEFLRREVTMVK